MGSNYLKNYINKDIAVCKAEKRSERKRLTRERETEAKIEKQQKKKRREIGGHGH
uniref:Uncharacterized protein n=1 Tax=Rhizophora mucronata TaxID=61149 RepID=A0A2P2M6J9_RHIMU